MLPRVHDIFGTMRLCKALLLLCAASTDALVPPGARALRARPPEGLDPGLGGTRLEHMPWKHSMCLVRVH